MDTAQWPQEIGLVKPMEEMVPNNACSSRPGLERSSSRARPQKEQALNCPRCNSTNTKFCYYNNYSLTQPRYFCKTCRRYWTEGGSLRNVPVGGGSRKNKRSSSSSSSSSTLLTTSTATTTVSTNKIVKLPDLIITPPTCSRSSSQNHKINEGQDLNLAFPSTQDYQRIPTEFVELPNIENNNSCSSSNSTTTSSSLSALDLLRTGITSRGLSSFMPMPVPDINTVYSSGFALQDFKQPVLTFGVDGLGSTGNTAYGGLQGVQGSSGRLLIPFEELKPNTTTTDQYDHQNRGQAEPTGYWSGMLGGGSW